MITLVLTIAVNVTCHDNLTVTFRLAIPLIVGGVSASSGGIGGKKLGGWVQSETVTLCLYTSVSLAHTLVSHLLGLLVDPISLALRLLLIAGAGLVLGAVRARGEVPGGGLVCRG